MSNRLKAAGIIAFLVISAGAYYRWATEQNAGGGLTGTIEIDGSSTVFPVTQAVAEEFQKVYPSVRVNVGISGTGGGFKRFTSGETDVNDASRPIKGSEEERAAQNGVQYLELRVALDGIAVVVSTSNTWVDHLTVEELTAIWEPGSTVDSWDDVRTGWPSNPLRLYGPGTDSGTFDYFTEVVVGEAGASRPDYTASEDDNILIQGVSGDRYSLGYFGYAFYAENQNKLRIVSVDSGAGPVAPSDATISGGQYTPLSRPIFIYVSTKSLERPEVRAFVVFYMENALDLVSEVGYTPLPEEVYLENLELIS